MGRAAETRVGRGLKNLKGAREMIVIGRPINGVTLKGLYFICDDNGEIMKFKTCMQTDFLDEYEK